MKVIRTFKYNSVIYLVGQEAPQLPKVRKDELLKKKCIGLIPKVEEQLDLPVGVRLKKTQVTKWNLNPTLLGDKSLEQLQVLIVERGGGGNIPELSEDCINMLSKDFLGEVK